jgi:UDP-3-O-[3-hydroxymyristoyl] glucosamine N-acyltransferase
MKKLTSTQIAEITDGTIAGDDSCTISGVAALQEAEPCHLSFLGNTKYKPQVLPSLAAIVIVPPDFEPDAPEGRCWIIAENPSAAFSIIVAEFAPPEIVFSAGIHPTAVVDNSARVPEDVHVGAHAVIEADAKVGAGSTIGAGSYIGHGCVLGENCRLHPNVTVLARCVLGNRVVVHSSSVVGSDGFGFMPGVQSHEKIPQVGIVQLDDDVELGSNVSVDRARFGRTWIKAGTKVDNLVQIAHNVVIGERCFIVAQVGIAGSSVIGDNVILAGQVGVGGHVTIGDSVVALGRAAVWGDVEPGLQVGGEPAIPRREMLRQKACLKRLPDLVKRVDALEKGE